MREILGVDTLAFLSVDGLYEAMGGPGRDPANPQFTDHYFTGDYPTHLTDQTQVEPQPRQFRCWRKRANCRPREAGTWQPILFRTHSKMHMPVIASRMDPVSR